MDGFIFMAIPAVPLIVGIALLALTWSQFSQSRDRLARGQVAIGTVVGYEEKHDLEEGTNAFYPHVNFTDAQGNSRGFISSVGGMKSYDIGAEVEVLYDPETSDVVIKSFKELYLSSLILGVLGAVFCGIGVVLALLVRSGA